MAVVMSSSKGLSQSIESGISLLAAVVLTAVATYTFTKRREDAKHAAIAYEAYQQEKKQKEKTAEARKIANEPPSGTLIEEIKIEKVFLWMLEDLRKRFPSENVVNVMKNKPSPLESVRASTLRKESSLGLEDSLKSLDTNYNKLINDHDCILFEIVRKPEQPPHTVAFMRAGPRKLLHFDPKKVNAAIVTCGGLCPGLNNVIREITKTLHQSYGIDGTVYGIQGGYRGFYDKAKHLQPVILTPELVENIHHNGGTCLGSSRGGFDLDKIINFLEEKKVCQLYVIGGDGTHRGAFKIHEGCMERGLNISVAGIPKTIDNDIDYIDHSFGFSSAVEAAQYAIRSAKTEAVCNLPNGIGIVKLMGRSAGFIAAHATMASSDVDLCLVPEVPIVLEGEHGCLPHIMRRVAQQGYAVIVCAEGGTFGRPEA